MTRRVYNQAGQLVSEHAGTQPHPAGNCARDELGNSVAEAARDPIPERVPLALTPAPPPEPPAVDVLQAIRDLDGTDPSKWTSAGKPQVKAIEGVIGRPITTAQRDAAWAVIKAEKDN